MFGIIKPKRGGCERNQTAELLFSLRFFFFLFLVQEMTSLIGKGRIEVKEDSR